MNYFVLRTYVMAPCLSKIVSPEISFFGVGIMRLAIYATINAVIKAIIEM